MAKICMNDACQVTTTLEWKKGWALKSGGFATLCFNCGSAYANLVYCETFHRQESGWRECRVCGKDIHCGCIASKYLHDYLDFGGVGCISCTKSLETRMIRPIQIPKDDIPDGFDPLTTNNIGDPQSSYVECRMGGIGLDKGKRVHLDKNMDAKELSRCPQTQRSKTNSSIGKIKLEEIMLPIGEVGPSGFPDMMHLSVGSSFFAKPENSRRILEAKDMYESLGHLPSNFSVTTPLDAPDSVLPSPENSGSPFQRGQKTCHILPKPPKTGLTIGSEANKGLVSQTRVGRPTGEGRGRNQLLQRYWPRITDQELQQISGDLNSTIVPLFEKVLSASDAGRIGRLVLPKACAEDSQASALPDGDPSGETSVSGVKDNMPTDGGRKNENSSQCPMLIAAKKRTRNIGSKSKRLLMHSEDAMELRVTWKEAQELLRPSPSANLTIVMIEDKEFEEYDEQWAQCDNCCKWRRLPVDVLLPSKWTCSDNTSDLSRCSCSASEEMNPKELESRHRVGKDFKKRRITESPIAAEEPEASGLDALATAAVLRAHAGDLGELSVVATTKHPRHRPGCTCIVCIQPPSGKGKHKPTCICNACLTVKRRFKTLMLRKKKRQSEHEVEEIALGKELELVPHKDEPKMESGTSGRTLLHINTPGDERSQNTVSKDDVVAESSKGQLDLNCHPNREDEEEAIGLSMRSLVRAASLPLEAYLRQSGITNLGPSLLPLAEGDSGCRQPDEDDDGWYFASLVGEHENTGNEG
ncbi:hypothetical protein U1Q18_033637 [Sarracenia purpurea var. burkii]